MWSPWVGAVCCPHDLGKCCIPEDHKLIVHEVYAKKACMYISRIQSKGVKTWRFSIFSTMCNPPLTTGQGLRDVSPYACHRGEHKETSLLMYDGCRLDHYNAQGDSVCVMLVHIWHAYFSSTWFTFVITVDERIMLDTSPRYQRIGICMLYPTMYHK